MKMHNKIICIEIFYGLATWDFIRSALTAGLVILCNFGTIIFSTFYGFWFFAKIVNISFVASYSEFVSDTRKVVMSTYNSESLENLRFGDFNPNKMFWSLNHY